MKKKELGKSFPNLNRTIAYYSPISQFITLNEIDESELPDLFKDGRNMNESTKASIYIHETRHNLDHIATLWGQKNLLKLSNALEARISKNEYEFHKILPLKREENQFHYDEYYTEHYNKSVFKGSQDIWTWGLSSGIKFDISGVPNENEPIPFIKFSKKSGEPLVRVPLSIAALLETNSTFDEYRHIIDHINALPKMEKIVENKLLTASIFKDLIYNQNMAVYNSVVHLTANTLTLSDVIEALKISSSIATIALNLPTKLVEKIPISEIAKKHWKERNQAMLINNEYGYIFYLLVNNYAKIFKIDKTYELESLLKANNLPTSDKLMDSILVEFESIKSGFQGNKCLHSYFENLSQKGIEILKLRGLDGTNISTEEIIKQKHFTPDLICADTDFDLVTFDLVDIIKNPPKNLNAEQRYSFMDLMNSKLDEFFEIRGL
jgi:hypothetical protein